MYKDTIECSDQDEHNLFQEALNMELEAIKILLCQKNIQYGNSALNPIRIFSNASAEEQINVRIDDKLSRIMNQNKNDIEDSVQDLIGYLVLKRVYGRIKGGNV